MAQGDAERSARVSGGGSTSPATLG